LNAGLAGRVLFKDVSSMFVMVLLLHVYTRVPALSRRRA